MKLPEDEERENEEDRMDDRVEDDELVGRKIKALYENGWFIGKIKYFNTVLCEYKVDFSDGTSDYLAIQDIDGIEVILVE